MMRFTSNEMMFFHSITQGDEVFGFQFPFPRGDKMEAAKKETLNGLIKKGILESEERLAVQGIYPAKYLEDYKKSKKHIIINHIHLAPIENGDMVMLYPINKEFELCIINSVALWWFVLKTYPFLCSKKIDKKEVMDQPGLDVILRELYENDNNIMVGEFIEQTAIREQVFYKLKDQYYKYDFISGKRYQTDGYSMRIELGNILNVEWGDYSGR